VTWASWRVQRAQLLVAIGATCLMGIWLIASAAAMGHNTTWKYWTNGDIYVLYVLPGVLGLAIGTPLVAEEFLRGTNRLAWSQSVSRTRWLAMKLLVGGLVVAVLAALLTLVLEWWTSAVSISPLAQSGGFVNVRIQPEAFDLTGIVVVGYALFAFCLGAALGAVVRRPGWAFAAGIPIFAAVRLVIEQWVRPNLATPQTISASTGFNLGQTQGRWVLHFGIVPIGRNTPLAGHPWTLNTPLQLASCLRSVNAQSEAAFEAAQVRCAAVAHIHYVVQFQPENHYWLIQSAETAIFLAMAAALALLALVAVRKWRW
jgi:hypothetical protein